MPAHPRPCLRPWLSLRCRPRPLLRDRLPGTFRSPPLSSPRGGRRGLARKRGQAGKGGGQKIGREGDRERENTHKGKGKDGGREET